MADQSVVTMERILHVVPSADAWRSECMISNGPLTWFHVALGSTPEDALQGSRDWLAMARGRMEAGKEIP